MLTGNLGYLQKNTGGRVRLCSLDAGGKQSLSAGGTKVRFRLRRPDAGGKQLLSAEKHGKVILATQSGCRREITTVCGRTRPVVLIAQAGCRREITAVRGAKVRFRMRMPDAGGKQLLSTADVVMRFCVRSSNTAGAVYCLPCKRHDFSGGRLFAKKSTATLF